MNTIPYNLPLDIYNLFNRPVIPTIIIYKTATRICILKKLKLEYFNKERKKSELIKKKVVTSAVQSYKEKLVFVCSALELQSFVNL